jgi:chromosome segregation ATPase
MLWKILKVTVVVFAVLAGLFVVAGRRIGELVGYVRATADQTVDGLTEQIPDAVHDRKMEHEIMTARQELIDRQVQLNLSRGQIDELRNDIEQLEASVSRRQRLLAEAYPVLKEAIDQGKATVRFASNDFSMRDFQREIDDLMTLQDRETRQVKVKKEGLDRLEKSVHDGEQALADMRLGLEGAEQEVAVLKSRREQAQAESSALDMIASVTTHGQSATASIGGGVSRLKQDVERLEARNDARRDLAPVSQRQPTNQLSRTWSRLEELKAYHDAIGESQTESETGPSGQKQEPAKTVKASEVIIRISPDTDKQAGPADNE